ANKVPVKNGSTNMLKNHFYNKDYITQRFEKAKAEIGKKRIPVFYKQELATDVTNTKTYGIEMKPLNKFKPQMFSSRGKGKEYKKYKAVEYTGTTKVNGEERDISRRVFQRIDIDYKRIDLDSGMTNFQLMKKGRAPIWKDGTVIE